jgi:putative tryptophan/tyrosine transport system substrate-binding protein
MRRREFIALLGSAAAWPHAARAQQPDRVRRIAVLMSIEETDPEGQARVAAFRQGLRELGWTEGGNLRIDWRWSGADLVRMRTYALELVRLAPELIVANSSPVLAALREATRSIPIVFVIVNDPVGQGFIASLARPGGNITGFTFLEYSTVGKSLELLKQVAPGVTRVAFVFNPETYPYYNYYLPALEANALQYAVEVTDARVRTEAEIEAAVAKLATAPGGGLIVPPDSYILVHRPTIVRSAGRYRIPAIYSYRQVVKEGGLMSYAPDTAAIFRRSASYVDRILKGANPAELPAQAPTRFDFVINLKSAKELGLDVPLAVLALADEVVE